MSDYVIRTTSLTRLYRSKVAVSGVALAVPEGRIYGFLGPNGAGKTTTIRLLLGLIRPTSGEVAVFGKPLSTNRRDILAKTGAVVESPSLYGDLSGRENVEITQLMKRATHPPAPDLLKRVGLQSAAGQRVREYSQGMKQRLGLALALVGSPKLLILDEPTNGLDPAGIAELRLMIRKLSEEEGTTVFVSSHLLSEVTAMCTDIGIMSAGKLIYQGTLDSLLDQERSQLRIGVENARVALSCLSARGYNATSESDGMLTVAIATRAEATAIASLLSAEGAGLYHLNLEERSLEEVFLSLTSVQP